MYQCLLLPCFILIILPMCYSSPQAFHTRTNQNSNFCKLPGPLLNRTGPGELKLLEDCSNIIKFQTLPVPAPNKDLGVHPYVCCPVDNSGTLHFASRKKIFGGKVSENICPNRLGGDESAECVNFKKCEGILNQGGESVAHVDVCGWDEEDKALKVCCPAGAEQGRKTYTPHPRYSIEPETPYDCTNKADLVYGVDSIYNDTCKTICEIWKDNGGCENDKHFTEDTVSSWEMFHFMMMSCMKTCGRCGPAGAGPNTVPNPCQDEHPRCGIWAKNNMCVINPWFMGHTCRESCGVCGFLSPFDKTIQNIEGNIYTYKQGAFNDEGHHCEGRERGEIKNCFDCGRENVDVEATASCEATILSDKWALTSIACYPDHANSRDRNQRTNQTIRIRRGKSYLGVSSEEILEMKKVYKHPSISGALVELGRRITFDFKKYEDTPTCMKKAENKTRWIKCVMEASYEFKNSHDNILENCKAN